MTHTSLTFIVGLSFAAFFALISVILITLAIIFRKEDDSRKVGGVAAAALVINLGFSLWGFYPYKMEYHQWRHVQGTVQDVQARMLADGDHGTTQNYAVRLTESGQIYRCDDSRCALLKPGDHIAMWCIRDWQYASTSGYRCRYGDAS